MGFRIEITNIFPNPTKNGFEINYSINEPGFIRISIINLNGMEIEILDESYKDAGHHRLIWNTENVPHGAYFVRLEHNGKSDVKQVLVVR